ncbi:MAG: choice-of-anchor J domain-containing protein [Bacteroidales bacterium]|nr:choice-of-anchor J domain-containing protein [Bacteroidales bacterium]
MSKKLILFLMLALFGSTSFLRADVIEIGDGTVSSYQVPFNSLYGYSFTEQVFLASEIGMAGNITSISFKINQAYTSAQTNEYTVWMKNVARETFESNTDIEAVTAADVVFDGTWELPVCEAGEWITLTLDTPFAYDGTSNLLFAMHEKTSGYSTRYFVCTSVTNSGISYYSDSVNPDPYDLGSYTGSKVLRSNRNNIQLDITAGGGGGGQAAELTVHDGTATNSYVPVYGFYGDAYLKAEMVYPASELSAMNGGTINGITFYASSPAAEAWTSTWQVFVDEVADATISDFAGPGTVVYEGTLDGTGEEMAIEFTTPYQYNGGNLLIGVYNTTTGNYKSVTWAGETVEGASVQGYNYGSLSSISATQRNFLPKTTFAYTTGGDEPTTPWAPDYDADLGEVVIVNPADGAQNMPNNTTLRWTNAENAAQYMIEFGTVYNNLETIVDWTDAEGWDGSVSLSSLEIALEPNTRYFWRVYNQNNTGYVYAQGVFTSECTTATNVRVTADKIFVGDNTIVKWSITGGAIGELPETHIGTGTSTSSYLPSYSFYNYSLTQQIYTLDEIGAPGIISSISFYNAGSEKTREYDMYLVNTDKESFAGTSDWIAVTADDLVFTGSVTMAANAWTTFELDDPFMYDGSNLAIIMDDNTGSYSSGMSCYTFAATAQAIRVYNDNTNYDPANPSSYSGTVENVKNQIIINKEGRDGNRDLVGCNIYVDSVKVNEAPVTERQYTLTGLTYNMEGHAVNVTGVYDIGESNFSNTATVYVSGNGNMIGLVKEMMSQEVMEGVTVKLNGKDEHLNTVAYETTTTAAGAYTFTDIKAGNYKVTASYAGMESVVVEGVVVNYNQTTINDAIYMHETYTPVYKVYAEEATHMGNNVADVIWSFNNFVNPSNGGGNGGGQGNGSTFSVNFDDSQIPAGWTMIDGGSPAGYGWSLVSAKIGTGYGHNGSTDAMMSQSYDNNYGVVYPDNYLVTPQVTLAAGSTFSFYACAQDASYAAEHYGVAVADNANGPWTIVDEWTMTAKEGPKGARGMNAQGNWYQKTVDLSAYAGQKYIAIRHFNCSDQFYLLVDDITLSAGRGGNRELVTIGEGGTTTTGYLPTYNLYNYSCTNQIYTNEEIGGAGTISSIAFMPATVNTPSRNLNIYMVNTDKTSFTGATDWVPVTADDLVFAGTVNWVANTWCTIELTEPFNFDGTNLCVVVNDLTGTWTSSNTYKTFAAPSQALRIYRDASAYDPTNPGSGTVMNEKNQIQLDITASGGSFIPTEDHYFMVYRKNLMKEGFEEETVELLADNYGIGFADTMYTDNMYASLEPGMYQYGVSAVYPWAQRSGNLTDPKWSNTLEKDMATTVVVKAIANSSEYMGATFTLTNNWEDLAYNITLEENDTDTIYNFRKGEYTVTAELDGYTSDLTDAVISIWNEMTITANFTEILTPLTGVAVSGTGFARWADVLPAIDFAQSYYLTLDGVFMEEVIENNYQINPDILTVGQTYQFGVAVYYTTGLSAYATANFTYIGCEGVEPQVEDLEATNEMDDLNVLLTWGSGSVPTPPTPPTPPTGGWTEGFESGMPTGWTVVDGNNDGWTWCLTSAIPTTWTYYASLTLDWYRTGTNAICSGSYINGVGALTPNEYLVMGQQTITAGSTLSFWAAAADAGYPADHFGVAVSDDGTNWTMVQEWTLTGKDGGMNGGRASRDGNGAKLGSWHQFTADLSAYAGTKYLAIRHFNCNDQYIMVVDDIEFTTADKSIASADNCGMSYAAPVNRDMWDVLKTFNAAEGGQYGVVTDGQYIYTSNWGYSSAANNFYKYDMDGNVIEGFNISGCGTLRGMTFDGQYIYGVANSSTVYCVDLNNHTLVSTFSSAYGAMRCISYDPQRDGFWVVGNWSGNLTLIDRTGAIVQVGPEPTSASDVAYWKDADGVEHVYCFNNGDNGVYDYNITTGVLGGQVFNFSAAPGFQSGASAGGCHIANYGDKLAFYGDVQQSPNLIAIYELGAAQGGGGGSTTIVPNKYNVFFDGEFVGATAEEYMFVEAPDFLEHDYTVVWIDENYNISCENTITYAAIYDDAVNENGVIKAMYPNPTNGDIHVYAPAMKRVSIINALGQMVYDQAVSCDQMVVDMSQFEAGVYMVNVVTENGSSVKRVTVTK